MIPELISYLKRLERKGIKSLYLGDASIEVAPTRSARNETRESPTKGTTAMPANPNANAKANTSAEASAKANTSARSKATVQSDDVTKELAQLEQQVLTCTDCALHEGRTNGVFGTGSPTTNVMFIGEGPGAEEDRQGKPFVGRSGQLLTKMIEAIDLTRDRVYIANIVKCRPPNNRDPLEEEVRCCEKYLKEQIRLIRPRVICALGRVSAHWLLQTDEALGALRKSEHYYEDTPVLVTYHPAALLRNPNLKRNAWEDFKKLREMIAD
jgi:uracil-DNA glycosylase family 4